MEQLRELWEGDRRKQVVNFRSPLEIWEENPTILLLELVFYIWGFLTVRHAWKHGGRYLQLWFAALLHGMVTENLSYWMPDIDNFWHCHTSVMFFQQRQPLYIVLFYPCFLYTINIAASRLKLGIWSESFVVGLGALAMDIPFDVSGANLLWWTWHDTDPNVFDRTYNVPWTSYMYQLSFCSSFTLILNTSRWLLTGSDDREKSSNNYFSEFVCIILTGFLSMPVAVVFQFLPFYNAPRDIYGVHTEVCVMVLLGLYVIIAWSADRNPGPDSRSTQNTGTKPRKQSLFDEITATVMLYFLFLIAIALWATPESYRSTSPHQEIGPCNHTSYINTISGVALPKQTYLCMTDYNEPFSFDCLNGSLPSDGATIYTVCGIPYPVPSEHKTVVIASCLFGLAFFYQLLFKSALPAKLQKVKKA